MTKEQDRPWAVTYFDPSEGRKQQTVLSRQPSREAAEGVIALIAQRIDPDGAAEGFYGIDGPESDH